MTISFPHLPINLGEILLVASIVIVVALFFRGWRRGTRRVSPFEETEFQRERLVLASILDGAAAKLSSGSGYRETVLQCYNLISQILEEKSAIDGRTLTAREFRRDVSEILRLESPYLSRVTDLFEVARYSQEEITKEEALAASDCFSNLATLLKETTLPDKMAQKTTG